MKENVVNPPIQVYLHVVRRGDKHLAVTNTATYQYPGPDMSWLYFCIYKKTHCLYLLLLFPFKYFDCFFSGTGGLFSVLVLLLLIKLWVVSAEGRLGQAQAEGWLGQAPSGTDQGRGRGYGAEVEHKLNYGNATVWQKNKLLSPNQEFSGFVRKKKYWLDVRQG